MNLQFLAALGAACLLGGVTLDRCAPVIGAHSQIERVKGDRDTWKRAAADWKRAAGGWEASFRGSESRRAQETTQARTAVAEAAASCDSRVAQARHSAAAIAALISKEPKRDPQGCPIRQLLDPRELRGALSPPAPH